MNDIQFYVDRNTEIIKGDKARNALFEKIDAMIELDYQLPKAMSDMKWMRKIVSTDPLSAITTGRRTLATVKPSVFLQPLNAKQLAADQANETEQVLLWQLKQSGKRSKKNLIGDVVESGLRYDMIVANVIPLAWQLKPKMRKGIVSELRYMAAKKLGGFLVMVENPKDVHARFSALGLESVLTEKVMLAQDVIKFYGKDAKSLIEEMKDHMDQDMWVTVFDSWDYDERVVYCSSATTSDKRAEPSEMKHQIIKAKMDLPFLPWVIEEGGTSLSRQADHGFRPILGPIAHTNMWETQNIARSLAFAEAIAYSAAPRAIIYSYADETIRIDYGDINKPVILKPGEEYKPIDPPAIDENLLHVFDRTGAEIDKLTGIKNLANLDPPSGTAFATVNAVIKAATSALDPAKELAQDALAGVFKAMLLWSEHTGENLSGFTSQEEGSNKVTKKASEIDADQIFIDVELSAHVPTDRLQRINAASQLNQQLNFSLVDAYRELDISNPEEIIGRWQQEQLTDAEIRNTIKMIDADADLVIAENQLRMEMGLQQEQEANAQADAQAQEAAAQEQQVQLESGLPTDGAQSAPALGGSGFDPAAGGISPNEADPEGQLREQITQTAKGGAPA